MLRPSPRSVRPGTCTLVLCFVLVIVLAWYGGWFAAFTSNPVVLGVPGAPLEAVRASHHIINGDTTEFRRCENAAANFSCVHIVMAANYMYLKPLIASINSMKMHTKRPIYIHMLVAPGEGDLFHYSLSRSMRKQQFEVPVEIVEFGSARVIPLIRIWDGQEFHASPLNYARFYLPYIFPALTKVVYIDPDTIVLGDVGELNDMRDRHPHNLHSFAAVPANLATYLRSTYSFVLACRDEKVQDTLNCANDFFNAGVFVTDLAWWRKENITGQSEEWMIRNTQQRLWKWGSQPPMNLVFEGKWSRLESVWNFREAGRPDFSMDELEFVKIMHFTGHAKPWHAKGFKYWHLWCPYYPFAREMWFCRRDAVKKLHAKSPYDYRFVKNAYSRTV